MLILHSALFTTRRKNEWYIMGTRIYCFANLFKALRITRIEEHPLILLGSSSLESNSTRSRKVKNQSLNSAPKSNCKGKSISQTSFPNSNVGMTYQTGRSASPHPRLYEVLSTEMQDTPNDLQKESDIPPIVTAQFYEDVESPSKMVLEAVEIFKILLNCETVLHEILSDSEDSVSSLPGNAPESNVRDALVDIPKADTEGISEDWQSFNDSFGIEQVSGNFALPRDASGLTHDDDDTLLAAPHHDDEEVHFIEGSNVSNVDESLCNESLKTPSPSVISIDLKSTLENPGGIFDDLLDDHIVVSRAIDKPLCQESFKQPTPSFFCLETTTEMSDESCCKEYTKSSTPTTQEDSSSTEFARAALPDAFCKSPSKDAVLERTLRAIDSLKSKYTPPSTLANRRWSSNSCSYTQPTSPTSNRTITMKPVLSHSRKTSTSSAGHKPEEAAIKILPPHLRALSGSSLSTPAEGLISPRFPPHVRAIMAANSQTADFEDAGATLQFPPHTRTPHLIPAVTNMTAETFPTPFIHLREDRLENQNHFETEDLPNITVPPKAGPVSSPLSKVNSNKLDTEPPEPCLAVYADMEEDAETIVDNAKYLITHDSSSCSLVGFFNACS